MNNNLSLIKKDNFNGVECDLWKDDNNQIWMTREQIGTALEYSKPRSAIEVIHRRNKERLSKFSVAVKMTAVDGKIYDTTIYNTKGVYEICRYSKQPKANDFYDWVYDILEGLRTNELSLQYNIPKTYAEALQLATNLQLQLEEQQPKIEAYDLLMSTDGLYNMKQVADLYNVVGRNTLLKILREKQILSSNKFNKNLPYTRYNNYFNVKITPRRTSNGLENICTTLCTTKGLKLIEKVLNEKGLLSPQNEIVQIQ